jgi:hypothetical protein
MRRNQKIQNRKLSLLAKTTNSVRNLDTDDYIKYNINNNPNNKSDYNKNKLNKNIFRKTFNKTFRRNSSLKICEYNQKKKIGQTYKSYKDNEKSKQ